MSDYKATALAFVFSILPAAPAATQEVIRSAPQEAAVAEMVHFLRENKKVTGPIGLESHLISDVHSHLPTGQMLPENVASALRRGLRLQTASYPADVDCPRDSLKAELCSLEGVDAIIQISEVDSPSANTAVVHVRAVYETGTPPREGVGGLRTVGYEIRLVKDERGWKAIDRILRLS